MIRDFMIYCGLMFLFIGVSCFQLGRHWQSLREEEEKSKEPIKYIPQMRNKW